VTLRFRRDSTLAIPSAAFFLLRGPPQLAFVADQTGHLADGADREANLDGKLFKSSKARRDVCHFGKNKGSGNDRSLFGPIETPHLL
jgi:hypothetical protein